MIGWRDLLAPLPEIQPHPQNPQNEAAKGIIAHCADIADRAEAVKLAHVAPLPTLAVEKSPLPVPPPIPTVQPGDWITWQGSSGKASEGVIDFLYTYPGEVWAFCTLHDGGWTAVNVKYIRKK